MPSYRRPHRRPRIFVDAVLRGENRSLSSKRAGLGGRAQRGAVAHGFQHGSISPSRMPPAAMAALQRNDAPAAAIAALEAYRGAGRKHGAGDARCADRSGVCSIIRDSNWPPWRCQDDPTGARAAALGAAARVPARRRRPVWNAISRRPIRQARVRSRRSLGIDPP
jgi:hypothetical protein